MSAIATCARAAEKAGTPTDQQTSNHASQTIQSTRGKQHLSGRERPCRTAPNRRQAPGGRHELRAASRKGAIGTPGQPQDARGAYPREGKDQGVTSLAVCGFTDVTADHQEHTREGTAAEQRSLASGPSAGSMDARSCRNPNV